MGVNRFADLTETEWAAFVKRGSKHGKNARLRTKKVASADELLAQVGGSLPNSVDWLNVKGMVGAIKDQGQCGSCWAFATTFAVESSHNLLVNGTDPVSLSEQQLVSCDTEQAGCNGGDQLPALKWLAKQKGGQCSEAAYPYTSGTGNDGVCKTTCTGIVHVTDGIEVEARNETALMAALAYTPLSMSVDASSNGWQLYAGGVYTAKCKCDTLSCLDHAVGGVGYGTDSASGFDFWNIRNSWGADWGENGYIRLARGTAYLPGGQCGALLDNQYATTSE